MPSNANNESFWGCEKKVSHARTTHKNRLAISKCIEERSSLSTTQAEEMSYIQDY